MGKKKYQKKNRSGSAKKLCKVTDVYVPSADLYRFLDDDVMPSMAFNETDIKLTLQRIGAKTHLDTKGVLISAKSITKQFKECKEKYIKNCGNNNNNNNNNNDNINNVNDNMLSFQYMAVYGSPIKRSQGLLEYLDRHWEDLKKTCKSNNEWLQFVTDLIDIKWVPICQDSPHRGLIWEWDTKDKHALDTYFARPDKISPYPYAWLGYMFEQSIAVSVCVF